MNICKYHTMQTVHNLATIFSRFNFFQFSDYFFFVHQLLLNFSFDKKSYCMYGSTCFATECGCQFYLSSDLSSFIKVQTDKAVFRTIAFLRSERKTKLQHKGDRVLEKYLGLCGTKNCGTSCTFQWWFLDWGSSIDCIVGFFTQ